MKLKSSNFKIAFLFFVAIFFIKNAIAQTANDALRYSLFDYGGSTARSLGVGGSMSALGAEFSTISTNPAALAMYRRSEMTLSPAYTISAINSNLLSGGNNSANKENRNKFTFSNIGAAFASRPRESRWRTFNVAIGYNRLGNFYQNFEFEGSSLGSIANRWTELANSDFFDSFEVNPALETIAIYEGNSGQYINDFQFFENVEIPKRQTVNSRGVSTELLFAFAGNYDEKLMVGMTVGVPFLNYTEEKTYRESDPNDEIEFFNALVFRENLTTTGVGINAKIGLIYRLNQMLRLGASIQTPTAYSMTDNFSTEVGYDFTDADGNSNLSSASPDGLFDYKLKTPWRLMANAGVIIGQLGFVTAELEFVDYSSMSYNLTSDSSAPEDVAYEEEVNALIENDYKSTIALRLGGEVAVQKLRFRAGYGLQSSPLTASDDPINSFSLGTGVRFRNVYFDLGYRISERNQQYIPFLTAGAPQPLVENNLSTNRLLFTFGYKF